MHCSMNWTQSVNSRCLHYSLQLIPTFCSLHFRSSFISTPTHVNSDLMTKLYIPTHLLCAYIYDSRRKRRLIKPDITDNCWGLKLYMKSCGRQSRFCHSQSSKCLSLPWEWLHIVSRAVTRAQHFWIRIFKRPQMDQRIDRLYWC